MTKKQILEGNKIISGYDELKKDDYGKFFKNGIFKGYNEGDFLYHKSWDWLMPVVHKIYDTTSEDIQTFNGFAIFEYGLRTEMKDIWLSVVEFIKWYNKQNKK